MRYSLSIFATLLILFSSHAQTSFCFTASLPVTTPVEQGIIQSQQQKQRLSFKERLIKKILERKLRKASIDKEKHVVNTLGIISLAAGIAALVLLLIFAGIASYALSQVLGFLSLALMPAAVITGIISLIKRKKLADKKGAHIAPAIVGILIGGGLLLIILIALISISINGFTF